MNTKVKSCFHSLLLRRSARLLLLCWICCSAISTSPATAQLPGRVDERTSAPTAADSANGSFSVFLRETGRTSLWLDDLLARWRKSDDAQAKLRWSFELCVWLERELQRSDAVETRRLYPQLWSGAHVSEPAFAPVQLIELRKQLNEIAIQTFARSLHRSSMETLLDDLAEVQRRLREVAEDLNQLASNSAIAPPSLQSVQLQQLREAAEAGLAWSYYYEYLLRPAENVDGERLEQAVQIYRRLLGVSEPDMRPADWYQWFDPSRGPGNDWLLGLGLCSAALQKSDVASTCFATLQRQGDRRLSQRVILWHAHGLLKQGRWDDASLLITTYAQDPRMEEIDSLDSMVDTMLSWVMPENPAGITSDVPLELPKPVANWNWRLIELLVSKGKVEEAARLIGKHRIDNPGSGLTSQVLLLNSLLVERPLADRSQSQLAQLVERLSLWSSSEKVGPNKVPREIERWAQYWLAKVYTAHGDVAATQQVMIKYFEGMSPDDAARRQSTAWDLAQSFERSATIDMQARHACLKWYREAAKYPNMSLTAQARIKVRLWELAGQPLAQNAYLNSFSPVDDGFAFARRQLIVRLFEDFSSRPHGSESQTSTAAQVQREVWEQLGLRPPNRHVDESTWIGWQGQLTEVLVREAQAGNDNSSAALLAIATQTLELSNSGDLQPLPASILAVCARHAVNGERGRIEAWRPLLYAAAMSWDQNPWLVVESSLRQKIVDAILVEEMSPVQVHALMERTIPNLRQQWEQETKLTECSAEVASSVRELPSTRRLHELYRRWWEVMQLSNSGIDLRTLERVQLDYAEFLWRVGDATASRLVLETPKPSTESILWRRQNARAMSQANDANQRKSEEELWLELSEEFPKGSPDWLETKYYILRCLVARDAVQAKNLYQQIRQLYPDVPPPWSAALDRLAAQYGW
ncbi:MAG: hypothetical protein JNL67_09655 [Planctomycetaceae bacterium]|nr:hypothetical protein [Planctomycetaceae bacterium]